MKKTILFTILFSLSIIRTTSAQTVTPTINGTPPPFTFTGAVTQTGQNFNFTGGGGGGSFSTITSGTNTSTLVIGSGGSLSTTGTGTISATTATTAGALAATPTGCTLPQVATGIAANGNASCSEPSNISGNAATATSATTTTNVAGGVANDLVEQTGVGTTGFLVPNAGYLNWTGSNYAWTGTTGSGSVVLATSPVLSTPSLGTTGLTVTATVGASSTTQYRAVTRGASGTVTTVTLAGTGFQGFAQSTVTSGNPVEVCTLGTCTCIADNTVTAGDLLGAGTVTAGACRDLGTGQNSAIQGNTAIWGKAITSGSAGAQILVNTPGPGHFGSSIAYTMATIPMAITGGTYSFDSQGSGATAVVQVSGGAVSNILTWATAGSGYAVGDLISIGGGNNDSLIVITAINGSGQPTAGTIVYGGTGYVSTGGYSAQLPTSSYAFTFLLSGVLTSPATLIMTHGSYGTQSNQWIWANNTTGAFTVTVCVAGATDACSGGRTVTLAQGTNNSTSLFLQTDGELNVDIADSGLLLAGLPASFSSIIDSGLTPGTAPVCPNGTGGLLTTTGCVSPVTTAQVQSALAGQSLSVSSLAVGTTTPVTIGGSCPSPAGKVANADGTGCSALPTTPGFGTMTNSDYCTYVTGTGIVCGSAAPGAPSGTGIVNVSGGVYQTPITVGPASGDIALVGSTPTEIASVFYPASATGTVGAGTVLYEHCFGLPVSIPMTSSTGATANGTSSILLSPAPSATWVVQVNKIANAGTSAVVGSGTVSSVGTISVSIANIGTWSISATNFAIGDCIQYVAPGTVDPNAPIPTILIQAGVR